MYPCAFSMLNQYMSIKIGFCIINWFLLLFSSLFYFFLSSFLFLFFFCFVLFCFVFFFWCVFCLFWFVCLFLSLTIATDGEGLNDWLHSVYNFHLFMHCYYVQVVSEKIIQFSFFYCGKSKQSTATTLQCPKHNSTVCKKMF